MNHRLDSKIGEAMTKPNMTYFEKVDHGVRLSA